MAVPQIIDIGGTAYISTADAARMSGYSHRHITRLARAGTLPATRLGHCWLVPLTAMRSLTRT